jgi:pimeloyl-ACP methyl ester carboxylesterase
MIAFADALGLAEIDLLGFSIGGFVAQEIALVRPSPRLPVPVPDRSRGRSQRIRAR